MPDIPAIPTNYDSSSDLVPSWGSRNIPPSAAPDVVGAFRFLCAPGHLSYDDPIVYPHEPGKSHLHQFFGNLSANAESTYETLRTSGDSTCNNRLNRSAYWIPAMMNGIGKVVRPQYVSIYYKRYPQDSARCQIEATACVAIPRGLKFVFGFDMAKKTPDKGSGSHYNCTGPTARGGHYPDLVAAAQNCPAGNLLGAVINAPGCWDGRNLDSPDHHAHLAHRAFGNDGIARCPRTHPFIIPTFTLSAWYMTDASLDRSGSWDGNKTTWHLSSDYMDGEPRRRPGSTLHSDWFGAWDDEVMAIWTRNCIDKMLNCSGGDLGNGMQLKNDANYQDKTRTDLVDPPLSAPAHEKH